MVEGARLESAYMPKVYRGFESRPLRLIHNCLIIRHVVVYVKENVCPLYLMIWVFPKKIKMDKKNHTITLSKFMMLMVND